MTHLLIRPYVPPPVHPRKFERPGPREAAMANTHGHGSPNENLPKKMKISRPGWWDTAMSSQLPHAKHPERTRLPARPPAATAQRDRNRFSSSHLLLISAGASTPKSRKPEPLSVLETIAALHPEIPIAQTRISFAKYKCYKHDCKHNSC
jgi:hypothetical protein